VDNVWLTGALGTQLNVGSWIEKEAGIDYGAGGLIRTKLAEGNPYSVGAQSAYVTMQGPRRMTFRLIVPSGGVAGWSRAAAAGRGSSAI
jgi:hypothetical protein